MDIFAFSKTYQNRTVLSFPDFSFQPGMVYAIIGANGCGKSTFAKILGGILPSDCPKKPIGTSGHTIGYLPQKPYVFHMSLYKNLLINASGNQSADALRAEELLNALALTHLSNKKAVSLSGGETARMALARLMMKDYSVLILDEPCAAMDIPSTLQTEKLIRDYCSRTNAAVILITHSLPQARRIADQVLFFCQGQLLESGWTKDVLHTPVHEKTQEFLDFFR